MFVMDQIRNVVRVSKAMHPSASLIARILPRDLGNPDRSTASMDKDCDHSGEVQAAMAHDNNDSGPITAVVPAFEFSKEASDLKLPCHGEVHDISSSTSKTTSSRFLTQLLRAQSDTAFRATQDCPAF